MGGYFHDGFRRPAAKGFRQDAVQVQPLRRGVRRRQYFSRNVILDGSDQGTLAMIGSENRLQQERHRALTVGSGDASNCEVFCGSLVEISAQAGKCTAAM